MKEDIYILGINGSARASAALLKNGQIIAAALEERFTRIKNQSGYPDLTIKYCLNYAQIEANQLKQVYIGFEDPVLFINHPNYKKGFLSSILFKAKFYFTKTSKYLLEQFPRLYDFYEYRKLTPVWRLLQSKQRKFVADQLGIPAEKVFSLDHHTAHAFAAYYTNPKLNKIKNEKVLVVTMDGIGDGVSSKVFKVFGNHWLELAKTNGKYSLGWLYENVTEFLKMKPNEDEYKVMGLAPYADLKASRKVYEIFKSLIWVDKLTLRSKVLSVAYFKFLKDNLANIRFDAIAAGIQLLTEKITQQLIENAIKKTRILKVMLGGGVFMNVKANMKISQIPSLKDLYICFSCNDDSISIGSAYFGFKDYCQQNHLPFNPKPPSNLFLGPQFSKDEIDTTLDLFLQKNQNITLKKLKKPVKKIAQLLASGKIVARFVNRMEFGARALGNRSILAHPSDPKIVKTINRQIKGRDFWMPFCPTILQERQFDYLINPKKIISPYMMLTFETTKKGQKDLMATLHPYDMTARAQILTYEDNPQFYQIIKEFEKLTSIGALLNTSFNLHGQPLVCSPTDALTTFINSGLKYLVLEDYLLVKSDW